MKIENIINTLILYQFGESPTGDKVLKPKSFDLKDEDCETIRDALALVGMMAEVEPSKEKMEKFGKQHIKMVMNTITRKIQIIFLI